MEMFRAFAGFLAGLVVMGFVAFTGMFDGVSHWWSHGASHWNGSGNDDPNEHAHYTVRAVYQPEDGSNPNCLPHYEFHNRTNRIVTFYSDDGDQGSYGPPGNYGPPGSSSSAAISMQPSSNGSPPPYAAPNSGPSNYGPPSSGSSSYGSAQDSAGGGQGYADDSYEPRSSGGSDYGDDRYYDEYPGDADRDQGGCNGGGLVKIYLDRAK